MVEACSVGGVVRCDLRDLELLLLSLQLLVEWLFGWSRQRRREIAGKELDDEDESVVVVSCFLL